MTVFFLVAHNYTPSRIFTPLVFGLISFNQRTVFGRGFHSDGN